MAQDRFDAILKAFLSDDDKISRSLLAVFNDRLKGSGYRDMLERLGLTHRLTDRPIVPKRYNPDVLNWALRDGAEFDDSCCGLRQRRPFVLHL